jgi:opacity protein-like surface antigen
MRLLTLAALASIAALSSGSAFAADNSWYVRADTGLSFKGLADGNPDFKGNNGWTINGAVGRNITDNFRAEAEVTYQGAEIKGPRDGRLRTFGGFANGYFDFNPDGSWRPFVGAGIGVARLKVHRTHDSGFAYQLKTGIAHPFSDRLTGELAYRYMRVTKVSAGAGVDRFDGHYHDDAITVGVRYQLGS